MKKLSFKKAREMQRIYTKSNFTELYQVYSRFSVSKEKAFQHCIELMEKYKGSGLRILTYNTFMFTVGFYGIYNNDYAFFYITPTYVYVTTA